MFAGLLPCSCRSSIDATERGLICSAYALLGCFEDRLLGGVYYHFVLVVTSGSCHLLGWSRSMASWIDTAAVRPRPGPQHLLQHDKHLQMAQLQGANGRRTGAHDSSCLHPALNPSIHCSSRHMPNM
jgi:hypothetical protein